MNPHYAKLGDVWKHLPLAEILRLRPPDAYWETHAGSASYPLTPSPARDHGALRFLAKAPADADLASCAYLRCLRSMPRTYPGSATLAMRTLGRETKYLFCDTDPQSVQSLRDEASGLDVRICAENGLVAVERAANDWSDEQAAATLVHIDPFDPFERANDRAMNCVELAAHLARRGFRLFYWYGYDRSADRFWARRELAKLAPDVAFWCGDLLIPASFVYPGRTGAWGCGIVLASMRAEEAAACARIGHALQRICEDDVADGNDPPRVMFQIDG